MTMILNLILKKAEIKIKKLNEYTPEELKIIKIFLENLIEKINRKKKQMIRKEKDCDFAITLGVIYKQKQMIENLLTNKK